MRGELAEEFMALMLAAQKSKHKCPYCDYFKKLGDRMTEQYFPEKVKKDE